MFCCWQTPEAECPLDRERQYPWDHHYSPYRKDYAKLAHNLYTKYLARHSGFSRNTVVSPLCAEIALLMLHAGADDKAKKEIAELLGVDPLDLTERLCSDQSNLKMTEDEDCDPDHPYGKNENFRLYLANAILLSEGTDCAQEFEKLNINSDLLPLTVTTDKESVTAFIREHTLGHAHDVGLSRCAPQYPTLISTLHLRSNWYRPFKGERTFKMQFVTPDGRRVEVDAIHGIRKIPCWVPEGMGGAKFLQMLFEEDGSWSALFVMPGAARQTWRGPTKPQTMSELINLLTPARLAGAIRQMLFHKVNEVTVQIPKFFVERNVEMQDILCEMGVRTPLKCGSDQPGSNVNSIMQHIRFGIDERGVGNALPEKTTRPILDTMEICAVWHAEFVANNPFIFLVYHHFTGHIAYMGHIADPAAI
ncbi:serpin I2-like [Paramacrobiotus metropolitanus]|uniref:serpin I2-like n=1 Tax=Paramacrobiotus metropolitanus TaxID=2943436 RepID=UPI002445D93C|nr:serpin I2-like [Paramacrobiotus metropolitanus]